jgi:hypothetical protein
VVQLEKHLALLTYVPSHPDQPYKHKGWVSWPHWLGRQRDVTISEPATHPLLQHQQCCCIGVHMNFCRANAGVHCFALGRNHMFPQGSVNVSCQRGPLALTTPLSLCSIGRVRTPFTGHSPAQCSAHNCVVKPLGSGQGPAWKTSGGACGTSLGVCAAYGACAAATSDGALHTARAARYVHAEPDGRLERASLGTFSTAGGSCGAGAGASLPRDLCWHRTVCTLRGKAASLSLLGSASAGGVEEELPAVRGGAGDRADGGAEELGGVVGVEQRLPPCQHT